jgi:anti-sigma factor RsiW
MPFDSFEALARTADAIAETAEASAEVHDQAVGLLPGAAEHAERDRRFAAAERAAAHAYRNHEVPPDDVRQVIREARPDRGAQD